MLQRGGRLLLSPSDLNNFLACEHRTALDLARARGEILLQRIPRPDAELVAERGREHERSHLERLRERGLDVAEIEPGEGAAEATAEAMKRGADVIHQATFTAGNWRGAADFLLKVRVPSELGAYSYEPADAKLATHPKPYVIFQLLFYAAMTGQAAGARARARARGPRHRRDALVPPARLPGLRRPRPGALLPHAAGLPQGRAAAVPVSRRALRLLRLVGALPRPPARRRSPLARRRDHARAGDPARGGGRSAASPSSPTCRPAPRCPGSPPPTLVGLRQQAWLQVAQPRLRRAAARAPARAAPAAASRGCRRPRRATCSSTSRAIHTGAARASSTCSARSPRTATSRCGRTTARRSGPRSSAGSTGSRRASSATPTCTSTTTTTTSRPR